MTLSRPRLFARNISSNLLGYLVNAIVALLLTPIVQEELGGPVWGLWALIVSTTGLYGLFDLGVRSAVGQFVARYWSMGDMAGVNRTLNTAFVLLRRVALGLLAVTPILALTLPMWVVLDDGAPGHPIPIDPLPVQWALAISGLGIALNLPLTVWSTITYARERFDVANAIAIGESLLRFVCVLVVLHADGGILGIALVTTGLQLVAGLLRVLVAYRLMPGLRFGRTLYSKESVSELFGYGVFTFVVNAADKVVFSTDALVIAAILGPTALTIYLNGAILIPYFVQLVLMVTWTLTPYAIACEGRGDRPALRRLLRDGTRGSVFLAALIAGGLLSCGRQFLEVWIDIPENLRDPAIGDSSTVLAVLTIATLVRASSSCGRQVLFGMGRVRLLAGLGLAEALTNLGLSIVLVRAYGILGAAIGTLIPVVLLYFGVQSYALVRLLGGSIRDFLLQSLRASVPVVLVMLVCGEWVETFWLVDSWASLAAKSALVGMAGLLVGWFVVMDRGERLRVRSRLGLVAS